MRLRHQDIRPAAEQIGFSFDGAPLAALPGETVAAALSAAGIVAFRHTPSGAPRGLWCGMGACFDCLVTVDGRANQRACLTKVTAGMAVTGTVPKVPAALAAAPGAIPDEDCALLVVGGGPAGLSAAVAAAQSGVAVVLLDERDVAGGQYLKPLAASHRNAAPDAQFRHGEALRDAAALAGVTLHAGATVWGAFPSARDGTVAEIAALVQGRAVTFRPRRLILAGGAHERPVPIPGWTLPGVMTTGAMQTLARAQRVSPGGWVVIAGNGPLNLQLACELLAGGAAVVAVVEAAPKPSPRAWRAMLALAAAAPDLAWDGLRYINTLRRAGVPILWGSTPLECEGEGHFAWLRVRTPSGERRLAAEACALNAGFQPETGAARALGCAHRFVDSGLGWLETVTDAEGRSSVPGVFAVGDGAALGGARVALARGRLAGLAAARELGHAVPEDGGTRRALARAERFQQVLWRIFEAPPFDTAAIEDRTIICRCEELDAGTLRAAIAAGADSLPLLKKQTRAGMGRCQGRMCGATVARLVGSTGEAGMAAPRAPLRPVPVPALRLEVPEWGETPVVPSPTPLAWRSVAVPEQAERRCDVLVVGGGVVGLATALYLAREGVDVLLVDRDEPGGAASTANAGSLHVQLLPYDFGDKAEALGTAGPAAATLPLSLRSIQLWREIARDAGEPLGMRTEGGLMLAETPYELDWLRGKLAVERRAGIETHIIGNNELRSLAPYIAPHFAGAAFCPAEGQIDPLRGTTALANLARRAGARVLAGAAVSAIAREGSGFAVSTEAGVVRAGRIVNCAGPWADRIGAMLGVRLPMGGLVQQVIATEPAAPVMRHLVAHAGRHLSLKQGPQGHYIIGGAWPGLHDPATGATRNRRDHIQGNLWIAGHVVPALEGLHAIRAWTGMNVQLDRAPVVGDTPAQPGFFHAITSNGYTLGPVVARLAADAVLGRDAVSPHFSPTRFR